MFNFKGAVWSTALHIVELVVLVLLVWLILSFFSVDSETTKTIVSLVVLGLTKFVRSWDRIPVSDYVNNL